MGLHQTLKHCTECGHAVEVSIAICPKCKKVFEALPEQFIAATNDLSPDLSPAEIIAQMQEKKQTNSSSKEAHEHERTMSEVQVDAISQERIEFNRRWKELSGRKDSSSEKK